MTHAEMKNPIFWNSDGVDGKSLPFSLCLTVHQPAKYANDTLRGIDLNNGKTIDFC
jgi:hypothetical protein